MKKSNHHGYCPYCDANLDGDLIINFPKSQGYTEDKIQEYLKAYGADETSRWGRQIGQYDMGADCTTAWKCPDCEKLWGAGYEKDCRVYR